MGIIPKFSVLSSIIDARSKKATINIIAMFIVKGLTILLNFAYIPLLINSLNVERYGIWLTITTIIQWISFFDIGLGNGLRNKVSEYYAMKDYKTIREYVSTTYISMAAICIVIILLSLIVIPLIRWQAVFNSHVVAEKELLVLMVIVVATLSFQMLLRLITSILYGLQYPVASYVIVFLSELISFASILLFVKSQESVSLISLGTIISISPLIVLGTVSIVLFSTKLVNIAPSIKAFDWQKVRSVVGLGGKFFLIQLTSLLLFQSTNFLITQICGSSSVTEYNIAYKYIGVINMIFTIVATPFWSASTEAYTRKDYAWINKSIVFLKRILVVLMIVGVILVIVSPHIYKLWLGGSSIIPNRILLILLLLYFGINMVWVLYGSIINGIGKITLQFYVMLIEGIAFIILAIVFGKSFGLMGILISQILVMSVNMFWPRIQINRIFDGTAKGIWNR